MDHFMFSAYRGLAALSLLTSLAGCAGGQANSCANGSCSSHTISKDEEKRNIAVVAGVIVGIVAITYVVQAYNREVSRQLAEQQQKEDETKRYGQNFALEQGKQGSPRGNRYTASSDIPFVDAPADLDVINRRLSLSRDTELRSGPNLEKPLLIKLKTGEAVVVYGRIKRTHWYFIIRDDRTLGYAYAPSSAI